MATEMAARLGAGAALGNRGWWRAYVEVLLALFLFFSVLLLPPLSVLYCLPLFGLLSFLLSSSLSFFSFTRMGEFFAKLP